MARDAVATMGDLLPDDAGGRDAVHIAVVSCVAKSKMHPGQRIGIGVQIGKDYAAMATAIDQIGIVDPYLEKPVLSGERFWLYLYPRSITGLNHYWTHPAFPDAKPDEVYSAPSEKLASEKWIRDWAEDYGVTYNDMIEAAKDYLKTGDYFSRGGTFEGEQVPEQFWEHFERVTGTVVKTDDKGSFFTCSC